VRTRSATGVLIAVLKPYFGFCRRVSRLKPLKRTAPLRPRLTYDASGIGVQAMIHKSVLLTITFAALAVSPLCRAQNQELSMASAIEVVRADMAADRAKIITVAMNFSDKDAAAFWPIYRRYEYERSTADDRRMAVIKEYAEKYSTLTDADAKSMAERMFDYDSRLAELKKIYFKKFNKVLPALTVTKFFQLEHRIDLVMDMKVESSLPPLTQPQDIEQVK
jgi:hypothetical protein